MKINNHLVSVELSHLFVRAAKHNPTNQPANLQKVYQKTNAPQLISRANLPGQRPSTCYLPPHENLESLTEPACWQTKGYASVPQPQNQHCNIQRPTRSRTNGQPGRNICLSPSLPSTFIHSHSQPSCFPHQRQEGNERIRPDPVDLQQVNISYREAATPPPQWIEIDQSNNLQTSVVPSVSLSQRQPVNMSPQCSSAYWPTESRHANPFQSSSNICVPELNPPMDLSLSVKFINLQPVSFDGFMDRLTTAAEVQSQSSDTYWQMIKLPDDRRCQSTYSPKQNQPPGWFCMDLEEFLFRSNQGSNFQSQNLQSFFHPQSRCSSNQVSLEQSMRYQSGNLLTNSQNLGNGHKTDIKNQGHGKPGYKPDIWMFQDETVDRPHQTPQSYSTRSHTYGYPGSESSRKVVPQMEPI